MNRIFSIFRNIGIFMVVGAWIYFIASYLDVLAHNLTDYNYAWWNLFQIFVDYQ